MTVIGEESINDLRPLVIVAEVARHGTFTEAATYLGLSTASVSRSVAKVEESIGVRLFNRTTRRLQLTEEGQIYIKELDAGLHQIMHAHDRLKILLDQPVGKLRVLLPDTFCKNYVIPEMASFLRRYPKLMIDIHVQEVGEDPLVGGYDIACQFGAPPENSYIVRQLGSVPLVLVASPAYLESHGIPRSIEELVAHEVISLGQSSHSAREWMLVHRASRETVIYRPNGRCFFSGQLDATMLAAMHGVGIVQADLGAVINHLQGGKLRIVLPDYDHADEQLCLIYPHRDYLPQRTRVFIDFLVEVALKRLRPPNFDPYAFAA